MSVNDPVQEALWEGELPVCFMLNPSEASVLNPPEPFYTMLPRMSYIIAHIAPVIAHFQTSIPAIHSGNSPNGVWFEYNETPLKWHYPIGVLYDSYVMSMQADRSRLLPWVIRTHFLSYPTQKLLSYENEKTAESHFMQSLKQSTFVRMGSSKEIMNLPEASQRCIWESVVQRNLAKYLHGSASIERPDPVVDESSFHPIPLRLILHQRSFIQSRVIPQDHQTIRSAIEFVLCDEKVDLDNATAILHGISVPLDFQVSVAYSYFAYPDGFLYLILSLNKHS